MLESYLLQNESKTLEFKENTKSLDKIMRSIIAFANTSGGTIIIGITDKEKKVVGVERVLQEEERLASAITDKIAPLIIPDIQVSSFRNKELLVIKVPHLAGPFYLKSLGLERGTYVRIGSTNRLADNEIILSLQMLSRNIFFDELPCIGATVADIDDKLVKTSLSPVFGAINKKQYESLNIVTSKNGKSLPTNGGVLLFCPNRFQWFPDSSIACVCFADDTCEKIIDQQEIRAPLIAVHQEILSFINRNTKVGAIIHESMREDVPQYPHEVIREAVINAIVHGDYAMKGCRIQIAIFSNRIEITSPGGLPYGQTIASALSGISIMRNRVIGRIFREIKLIERLGTGLKRITSIYEKANTKQALFEEINTNFRVTLYSIEKPLIQPELWEQQLVDELYYRNQLGTSEIAKLWRITTRAARARLKKIVDKGVVDRIGTSSKDPYAVFKLKAPITKRIEYKGCDISYTVQPDYENMGRYIARATITIHAEDVLDIGSDLPEKSGYASFHLAEAAIIEKSKKIIDDMIKSGKIKSIHK